MGGFRGHGPLLPQVPDFSVGAGHARDVVAFGRSSCVAAAFLTLGRGNDQSPSEFPVTRWNAGPARLTVRGMTGFRGRKQPFGAEPVGGVRNREQGANCLSAASFCPAGSAARRPGSSQRQGCPFFRFFSLGRQRKERHPERGRCHPGDAGASGATFPRWSVGTIKKRGNDQTAQPLTAQPFLLYRPVMSG